MNVLDAINQRRSIRSFLPKEVEEEKLNMILEAARLSPSAHNNQDIKVIVVKDVETRKKLSLAAKGQKQILEAPVTLVFCGTKPECTMISGQYIYPMDCSIAMSFAILQATELGLGSCWVGHFEQPQVKEALGIPEDMRIVCITPIGYANENPDPRRRRSREEYICNEKFS